MTNLNPTAPQGQTDKPEAAPDGVVGGTFRLEAMSASGDAPAIDPSVAPARKGLRSTQTIALALLVAAAGGVVYGMRQAGIGPMGALATTKMPDYDVTKAPGSKTADHKRVLAQLEATTTGAQVPADQVQKNPFRLADLLSTDGGPVDDGARARRPSAPAPSGSAAMPRPAPRRRRVGFAQGERDHGRIDAGGTPLGRVVPRRRRCRRFHRHRNPSPRGRSGIRRPDVHALARPVRPQKVREEEVSRAWASSTSTTS